MWISAKTAKIPKNRPKSADFSRAATDESATNHRFAAPLTKPFSPKCFVRESIFYDLKSQKIDHHKDQKSLRRFFVKKAKIAV